MHLRVRLELGDVHVEGPVEAEGRRKGRDHLCQKMAKVSVRQPLEIQVARKDTTEGLLFCKSQHNRNELNNRNEVQMNSTYTQNVSRLYRIHLIRETRKCHPQHRPQCSLRTCASKRFKFVYVGRSMSRLRRQISGGV